MTAAKDLETEDGAKVLAGKVAIAVCKGSRSLDALSYALENVVSPGQTLHLLHVQAPLRYILTPMGNSLPVEQVNENVMKMVIHERSMTAKQIFTQHVKMCDKRQVKSEAHYLENESVPRELINQMFKLGIVKLVIGTSTQCRISRALKGGRSSYVVKHAPDFCTVVVVYKGKVAYTKHATSSFPREASLQMPFAALTGPRFSNYGTIEGDYISRSGSLIENRCCQLFLDKDDSLPTVRLSQSTSAKWANSASNQSLLHTNSMSDVRYSDACDNLVLDSNEELLSSNGVAYLTQERTLCEALLSSKSASGPEDFFLDDLETVKSQRDFALLEAELQENRCKHALKMAEKYEGQRNMEIRHYHEALREAKVAKEQALMEARQCAVMEVRLQVALKEKKILAQSVADSAERQQELKCELDTLIGLREASCREIEALREQVDSEKKRLEEAQAKLKEAILGQEQLKLSLEETKASLTLEIDLRKEAQERALQECIAKEEPPSTLWKAYKPYTEYTFKELQIATSYFHEKNKLGEGGYGLVYKGILHHTMVAIKVLAKDGLQGCAEFQREVELLSQIHHPHMLMLLGACRERSCIVYEYMANGSLEDRLTCKHGTPPLPWYIRFRICSEVATALLFLHSHPEPIVHRDLKPGNILLDHNFVSKIGDVGIAKLVPGNLTFNGETMYKETIPLGTFAYIDPDYQRTGILSPESDVYALGIVMLQLLTGKPAVGVADFAEAAVNNGQLCEILDSSAGDWPLAEATELAWLSLQCTEPRRRHRPHLETKVLVSLKKIQAVADLAAANMPCSWPSYFGGDLMIPNFFICPISQEIMEDPFIAADGFTYEKVVIQEWLASHDTSPMTNLQLSHKKLLPNHSLRSLIKEWQDRGQGSA